MSIISLSSPTNGMGTTGTFGGGFVPSAPTIRGRTADCIVYDEISPAPSTYYVHPDTIARCWRLAELLSLAASRQPQEPTVYARIPNVPCPYCGERAVRDSDGQDHVHVINDHAPVTGADGVVRHLHQGVSFYTRTCSGCCRQYVTKRAPADTTPKHGGA